MTPRENLSEVSSGVRHFPNHIKALGNKGFFLSVGVSEVSGRNMQKPVSHHAGMVVRQLRHFRHKSGMVSGYTPNNNNKINGLVIFERATVAMDVIHSDTPTVPTECGKALRRKGLRDSQSVGGMIDAPTKSPARKNGTPTGSKVPA